MKNQKVIVTVLTYDGEIVTVTTSTDMNGGISLRGEIADVLAITAIEG